MLHFDKVTKQAKKWLCIQNKYGTIVFSHVNSNLKYCKKLLQYTETICHIALPCTICTEASGVVCFAEFRLVARMADSSSKFGHPVCKLTFIAVAAVTVLTVRATQLRLVAGSVDHWTNGSCTIVLPTNGQSVWRLIGWRRETAFFGSHHLHQTLLQSTCLRVLTTAAQCNRDQLIKSWAMQPTGGNSNQLPAPVMCPKPSQWDFGTRVWTNWSKIIYCHYPIYLPPSVLWFLIWTEGQFFFIGDFKIYQILGCRNTTART